MTDSSIIAETRGACGIVTLNRPQVLNSLDQLAAQALIECLKKFTSDPAIRAVLITGSGKGFCAGQDLAELVEADKAGTPLPFGAIVDRYNEIVRLIVTAAKPVVCAVNGVSAGAGANIALCCDFVVAAENASFVQSFVQVGLVPDSGGSFFLPRLVGPAKAKELLMLGEKLSAAEALRLGLIYQVHPADVFLARANELLDRLAQMPTRALAMTKRALLESSANDLGAQLRLERTLQVEASGTPDYSEGIRAFMEKRKPLFSGK